MTVGTSVARRTACALWVDDQGDGIPARERERVWESFYRLDRHANSAVAGSGIGLYVVRELARLHGGDAWIEDAPDGGARVVIELPRRRARPDSPTSIRRRVDLVRRSTCLEPRP